MVFLNMSIYVIIVVFVMRHFRRQRDHQRQYVKTLARRVSADDADPCAPTLRRHNSRAAMSYAVEVRLAVYGFVIVFVQVFVKPNPCSN